MLAQTWILVCPGQRAAGSRVRRLRDLYDWVLYLARFAGAKKIAPSRLPPFALSGRLVGEHRHDLLRAAVRRRLRGQFSLHRHVRRFRLRLGGDPRGAGATSVRHVLYNTGRLTTYCFLGGLAGGLGWSASLGTRSGLAAPFLSASLDAGQRALAVMAGLLMIIMALQFFGLRQLAPRHERFRRLDARDRAAGPASHARVTRRRLPSVCSMAFCRVRWSTPWSPRPRVPSTCCPAVSPWRHSAWEPSPAMLVMGGLGRLLAPRWRQRGVRLAGSFILALGVVTLARGIVPMTAAMACTISGISHDAPCRRSVPPLPVAGRPAGFCANGERRELPVLLLWLLHRPSSKERQRRCVGGGVVPGASRRGQLSVHEHHAVQPAGVFGGIHAVPIGGFCPRFICCSGGSRRRRY